jgi:hypothetical protein
MINIMVSINTIATRLGRHMNAFLQFNVSAKPHSHWLAISPANRTSLSSNWVCSQHFQTTYRHIASILAALLHDVLDKKYVTPEEVADPYAFFLPFFESMASLHGLNMIENGRARTVTKIIDNVSWSTEKKLRANGLWNEWHNSCVELHCVQDADRLDAIGAFGALGSVENVLVMANPHEFRHSALRSVQHCYKPVKSKASRRDFPHGYDRRLTSL